jgi:hypothetical protein
MPLSPMTPEQVEDVLGREGPLTGAELLERTRSEPLPLWRLCRHGDAICQEVVGQRFLRLDRAVEGYARLSPSIRREFLTYTVLGLEHQRPAIGRRAASLREDVARISRAKLELARQTMASVVTEIPDPDRVLAGVTFILAGDITYGMAHAVPRPERSTGRMVRGSDLDVIVVATDELPEDALRALDSAIHRRKHYLLVHPDYREEIDYVVKRLARVREQLRFDEFRHMVASKILDEGQLLYGSEPLFRAIKGLVEESGVAQRLHDLRERAVRQRLVAEQELLDSAADGRDGEPFNLFYTREEGDEIY